MTPLIQIRAATPEDAERVGELAREFANYLREQGDHSEFRFDAVAYRRDGFGPGAAFAGLIAESDGRVVGYLLYHPGYDTDGAQRLLHVVDLYVEKPSRGRGVGRELMRAAAEVGRHQGASAMMWSVYSRNHQAKRFYEQLGGRPTRDLDFMYLEI